MGIGKGSQKFVNAGARPQDGACLTPWSTPLSTSVNYHLKFGHSRWSSGKVWLFVSRLSRSLKIIGTDTDRSATYDFLLVIHSNRGSLSERFRDKRRFPSKIANFPTHPCISLLRWGRFSWTLEFIMAVGLKKTRVMRLMPVPDGAKSLTCIRWDTTPHYDGRTDGQTDRQNW